MRTLAGIERGRAPVAEEADGRDQHQRGEGAARHHQGRRSVADDVADAEQRRVGVQTDPRRPVEEAEDPVGELVPEGQDQVQELVERSREQAAEDEAGLGAPLLARDQDLGAGRALGVGEPAVLLDDEVAPERDHHEDARGRRP